MEVRKNLKNRTARAVPLIKEVTKVSGIGLMPPAGYVSPSGLEESRPLG